MNDITATRKNIGRVANEFSSLLRERLTENEMAEIVNRNKRTCQNPDVCHSHDFCDANELMEEAFRRVFGMAASETGSETVGPMSREAETLWNEAWGLAKDRQFRVIVNVISLHPLFNACRAALLVVDGEGVPNNGEFDGGIIADQIRSAVDLASDENA